MEKVDRAVLEEILTTIDYDLTLLTAKGEEVHIEKIFSLIVEGDKYDFKCTGYTVTGGTEEKAETLEELFAILDKIAEGDSEYTLKDIGGGFKTVAELRKKLAFDKISMDGLLERYKEADRFTLTADYGDVQIDNEVADNVLKEIEEVIRKAAESQYLLILAGEREQLPPFDKLYEEINGECLAYRKKNVILIEKHGGQSFFCDVFATGKGKYRQPQELWHLYNAVDFVQACAYDLQRLKALKEVAPIDIQLEGLPVLKEALLTAKPTYCWHCTISGRLATVFTFELNEKTREWLKTLKDDYAFDNTQAGYLLDDLAFYRGEKILFSSCTHEHFHSDCAEE